ncbi:MAG: phosphonate ABC transporter substrate-binding protein [Alphaproteobacteria bacterium]|nr:MAG: phosphonate ABC transporter substrate-binding protein [Alphaproteobacteria bacterium]
MGQTQAPSRRAVLASLALGPTAARAEAVPPQAIRFGLTPVFLDSDLALIRDLESYLNAATGVPVELIKRRTYREVTAMLLSGQLDAAWICGYPFVQHRSALALLAVPLHRGSPLYQSYLITGADSSARHLGDLRHQSHAFSDPDSNSGFLVTRWLLAQHGDRPEGFFTRTFFAHGHRNVIRAVATGLAQSGSVDGYVWEVMADREPHLTAGTRVLARSDWHGFPPICCLASTRGGAVARALSAALVEMPRSDLGQRILGTLHLDGWVAGDPSWFDGIARMSAAVRSSDP